MSKYNYWHWNNLISKNEIVFINKFIDSNFDIIEDKESSSKDIEGNHKKNNTVKIILYKKIKHLLNNVINNCTHVARYNFGYDVFEPSDTDGCNLNIYSSKKREKYSWHTDGTDNPLIDIKLTILINLSLKKYEGGSFYLFYNNEMEVPELTSPGNVVMFKSAINHKVTSVTKGERRTLAVFLYGPAFR
tara:strand:+ start:4119 stop:4685 length:567 start_codon:yes stop_codon:yes gene_type:complete